MTQPGGRESNENALFVQINAFRAMIPTGLRYSRNHLWLSPNDHGRTRCGFTSFAVRKLGDIYRIEWSIDQATVVKKGQSLGQVESSKAVSELHAPASGQIANFNTDAVNDPSNIGVDPYGRWLFEYAGRVGGFFSPESYAEYLVLATGGTIWPPDS
jgi:glycine cleavage system H protein